MHFTIICSRVGWEEKALINTAKDRGADVDLLDTDEVSLNLVDEGGLNPTDVYLQRDVSFFRGLYATAILEGKGHRVVNSHRTSLLCGYKPITTLEMVGAGIPVPKTSVAFTKKAALKALAELGYPAILKPIVGSWGRLIALLKDRQSATALLEDREELGHPIHKIFYLQEYVVKSRDIRVFVVGDEALAAMHRYNVIGDWRSNVSLGSRAVRCEITPEIEELSLKIADAVGGGVLGVDLIEGQDALLANEVNHVPQFKGIQSSTNVNPAPAIIAYLKEVAKK